MKRYRKGRFFGVEIAGMERLVTLFRHGKIGEKVVEEKGFARISLSVLAIGPRGAARC